MNRRTFLASTLATAAAPLTAAQPKGKVKIVSSLPRVGSSKGLTDGIVNAITMAIADFAKRLPFEVTYEDRDDATRAQGGWAGDREKDIADAAAADKDVVALIGPYNSGAARVSAPILNKAGLVQITPSASWPGLTKAGPLSDPDEPDKYRPGNRVTFCRVCPHDASQGTLSADFAADELKAKSVYALDDKELYGLGLATLFKTGCEGRKLKVLGHESLSRTADPQALVKKLKAANPDLVYFGGTTTSGAPRLATALAKEGVTCPLLLPDGCYDQAFIDEVGSDALGAVPVFVTVGGINPAYLKGRGAEFVKRYAANFDAAPGAYAVYGYEAAAVVLEALRTVGTNDREAIRKAVVGTKDFDKGVLGAWSFDADGDTTQQPLTVTTIEKGKFRAVKVLGTK